MVNSLTARCPGLVAINQAHILTPPSLFLTVGMRCLCCYTVMPNVALCISILVLSFQKTLFQKSCGLFRCHAASNSSKQVIVVQSFSNCAVTIFKKCNLLTKSCRVWDVALGFIAVSLSTARSDLRVNLRGRSLLGIFQLSWMFYTCEQFFSLYNDGLNCLEMVL